MVKTDKNIEQFYKDVEALGLRFPVAAIAKETGINKSNVSRVLSREVEPSERLLKLFYEKFQKGGNKVSQETPPGDDVGAKLSAHEAMLSVLLDSTAALLSAASGENETVVRRRLQKAAEDYLKIGGV